MELKNKKWTEEEFFAVREKVLASWKTGNDEELQLDKAIEYLLILSGAKICLGEIVSKTA